MGNNYKNGKIRKAAKAFVFVLLMTGTVFQISGCRKKGSIKAEKMDSILEQGYLWETEDSEKYLFLAVVFPENATEVPTVTVTNQKQKNKTLEGTSEVAENFNFVKYTALITDGNWTATASCAGCETAELNLRVEEDDQFIIRTITLTEKEETQETTQEDSGLKDALEGILNFPG